MLQPDAAPESSPSDVVASGEKHPDSDISGLMSRTNT